MADGAIATRATTPAVLSVREGGGGRRSADVVLPGQEGSGVRLQKGSDHQHVGGGGMWHGAGVGGGTSSAMTAVVNDVPRASRSAAAAFFAMMDVWACGAEDRGGGCGDGRRWRLREQMLDGAMRADAWWRRTR